MDVGIGDSVLPAPEETRFPSLLGFPPPKIRSYAKETVIAEKLEAIVKLGMDNSRMKNFYDLWFLSRQFTFNGGRLTSAIRATFQRRGTNFPTEPPTAFTPRFFHSDEKARQWTGFLKRSQVDSPSLRLEDVILDLTVFLYPVLGLDAVRRGDPVSWTPPGPWT